MVTKSDHFITQMKLRELREQRTKLLLAYETLYQQINQQASETGQLRGLYDGLRQIQLARHSLHPDIANLEPLLSNITADQAAQETLSFWHTRLEQELANGQLRAEIVYTFGALLEEWAHYQAEPHKISSEQAEQQAALIAPITQTAPNGPDDAAFDPFFSILHLIDPDFPATMRKLVAESMAQSVEQAEVKTALQWIAGDEHRSVSIHLQAQAFLNDPVMLKELTDALTIQLAHIEEWAWPQDGIPAHSTQVNQKWRLFLDEDLPTASFLAVLGQRWRLIFKQFSAQVRGKASDQVRQAFPHENIVAYQATQQFQEAFPQTSVINQETAQQLFRAWSGATHRNTSSWLASDVDEHEEIDIWDEAREYRPFTFEKPRLINYYTSITAKRMQYKQSLREIERFRSGYGMGQNQNEPNSMFTTLQLINAEIMLARAAFPNKPLHIFKVDLKDYYPNISHELALALLQRYDVPQTHLNFFRTFLAIPLQHNGEVVRVQRGIPNARELSDLLGEQVLRLLDYTVYRVARVQIVRIFDDICVIAASAEEARKAWQAIQSFCQASGLTINREKCGSICINGERLPDLPATQPEWLMVTLDQDGQWNINQPAFTRYVQQARQEMAQIPSLLSQIERYNAHILHLSKLLAPQLPLGERHRKSVNTALQEFHRMVFGEQGAVEILRQTIRERFLGRSSSTHLPEAWFYWPITAGGAGLYQVNLLTSGYDKQFADYRQPKPPETRPTDWQDQSVEWGHFYDACFSYLHLTEPASNQVMETLVADFIQRGAELSAGRQTGLASYWRWILYLYGPQILAHLGTFRFLITELVPLQLIMRRYRQTNIDEIDSDEVGNDDHPF
ncbi:hypothetical protein KSF_039470 [Reticulibacter mediterranei]|uniref:Reverse transcriptase domain-containing protein n=1 Tax=Reticulibacter mediterranei TaxID=2778369 RepID=A0A8J3IEI6_9CHLR|nr:reverse transcriptase domain-containing protein [Reticulibacter mediterranei]GHO93899.1 hypothetical protein KSF_039470 [Reticulibacter mediterranei]